MDEVRRVQPAAVRPELADGADVRAVRRQSPVSAVDQNLSDLVVRLRRVDGDRRRPLRR